LSPEPLAICVQIFDLLSDASSAAPGACHFDRGYLIIVRRADTLAYFNATNPLTKNVSQR